MSCYALLCLSFSSWSRISLQYNTPPINTTHMQFNLTVRVFVCGSMEHKLYGWLTDWIMFVCKIVLSNLLLESVSIWWWFVEEIYPHSLTKMYDRRIQIEIWFPGIWLFPNIIAGTHTLYKNFKFYVHVYCLGTCLLLVKGLLSLCLCYVYLLKLALFFIIIF